VYTFVETGSIEYKYRYPHKVVQGMNHCQYCSGELPDPVREYWIEPEISVEEAMSEVADAVNVYLLHQFSVSVSVLSTSTI
jgi:hypothetical protein